MSVVAASNFVWVQIINKFYPTRLEFIFIIFKGELSPSKKMILIASMKAL